MRRASMRQLLGDLDEFGACSWDRTPLQLPCPAWFDPGSILCLGDLDRLMTSRHVDARLIERNIYLDPATFREEGLDRRDGRTWLLDPAALLGGFRSGRTIIVPAAQEAWAPIDVLASQLADLVDAEVTAWLFVSPAGAISSWHADESHGFILQLHGAKRWLGERDGPEGTPQARPPLDVRLEPGDVLYVPKHFLHSVRAQYGLSVHITFNCQTPSLVDRATAALATRVDELAGERRRRSLANPRWGPRSEERWRQEVAEASQLLRQATESLQPAAFTAPQGAGPTRRLTNDGAFLAACASLRLDAGSAVRVRPGSDWSLDGSGAPLRLHFDDRVVELPSTLEPAVRMLLSGGLGPVKLGQLPLSVGDALVLARRLVAEGLLEPCDESG